MAIEHLMVVIVVGEVCLILFVIIIYSHIL